MAQRTLADIELSRAYFQVLIDLARTHSGNTIHYSELVAQAKLREPNNEIVQRAIATSAGRRLDALREFTNQHGLPDLSALVVSKATGDNGAGFKKSFDGEAVRQSILDFDWSSVQVSFDAFIANEKVSLAAREEAKRASRPKRVREETAREMLWAFHQEHRDLTAGFTPAIKQRAVALIMTGMPVADAVRQAREQAGL